MRIRFRRRAVAGVGLGVCLALGSASKAALGAPDAAVVSDQATAPPLLELAIVGELREADALSSRILSWFRGLPTLTSGSRIETLHPSAVFVASERPGVRVWALSRSPELLRLFFAVEGTTGDRQRYLVRDVPLDAGLDELGMERVAQVVYLSALALWSGQLESTRHDVEVGLGVAEAPAPSPVVEPSSPRDSSERRRSTRIAVGFEYTGRYAGPAGLSHGPGASLGLVLPAAGFEWGPRLHAQLLLPQREEARGIGLELRGSSFALGLAGSFPAGARDAASLEVGAGLDAVRFRVLSLPGPSFRASSSALDFRPFMYVSAGVETEVGFVRVGAFALLALSLLRTHYDVVEADTQREILAPWLLQPGFGLRVTW